MTGDALRSKDDRTDAVPADHQAADVEARTDSQADDITLVHAPLAPPPTDTQAQTAAVPTTENAAETLVEIGPGGMQEMVQRGGAFVFSTIFHLVGLLVLGLCTLNTAVQEEIISLLSPSLEKQPEELPVELELEQDLQAATEVTQAIFDSAVAAAAQSGSTTGTATEPQLDQQLLEEFSSPQVKVQPPSLGLPSMTRAFESLPEGILGDPRMVVDSYQQAMDQITQEILWMLERGNVLVVWCFDQSQSMKDDQREIRDRINKVYAELGLVDQASGNHLLTAVTSFGAGFQIHTAANNKPRPTSNRAEIRDAIDLVPVDPSGTENMCGAVRQAIGFHRPVARRRQMILILVSDESGNRENNVALLENTISEARAARCRIYTMGREAVFGYPWAHIRYKHPQTKRTHWLRVDRGPETAFVEQLQTNGFHRRHDAFSSGFGPYDQARLSRETGGIFFLLPSVEADLVGGKADKRRYNLDAMRPYRPDLRARLAVVSDRNKYPLRSLIWRVVNDLDPTQARQVNMPVDFPLTAAQFLPAARAAQTKAATYINYLGTVQKMLESGKLLREQEPEPRWQANYDLILAQVVAYQARMYEYGVALEQFIKKPKTASLTRPPNLRLVDWNITTNNNVRTETSKPYIKRSTELFNQIIADHPGTPWAERAQEELTRGFGVDLVPDYDPPYIQVANPKPLPKL
ncbi:MAG: vWA domain-containing protein [Planctomycetota bacterium]|nr:vWA domain-containing protein [Planctomycetota bacterium]